ncbi:MAG TPA: nuclear transport factor 2 family protein [Acidimicrobiia bacterium]|nr:nuclear transport factor 2 family protein [Acidimicrobiia bacterium]
MSTEPAVVGVTEADIEAITKAATDYLEGFLSGDHTRHLDAYHPEAVKRRIAEDEHGVAAVTHLSPQTMSDYAALQIPKDLGDFEIVIDGVYNDIATVRVYSQWWVDFLHIVKARGSWKLFHVTWYPRS